MATPTNYFGTDLGIFPNADDVLDLDPSMLEVNGRQVVIQSIICRLSTPLGSVIDSPNDCFDLRDELSDGFTPSQIASLGPRIQNQVLRDQRIKTCTVNLDYDFAKSTLTIAMQLEDADGPFPLTLVASKVTVAILKNSQ
jgi:hypothetical protein